MRKKGVRFVQPKDDPEPVGEGEGAGCLLDLLAGILPMDEPMDEPTSDHELAQSLMERAAKLIQERLPGAGIVMVVIPRLDEDRAAALAKAKATGGAAADLAMSTASNLTTDEAHLVAKMLLGMEWRR